MIELEQLKQIMLNCRHPESWVRPLNQAMQRYAIDADIKRVAAFLAQIAVESGELNRLEENLNYSPQRLVEVWPTRFPDVESARPFGRNPEKLANKVYADRLGNGNFESGDGFRYRGRGIMQITGRHNYEQAARAMDLPELIEMPDYLLEPRYAARSAASYWDAHSLNDIADKLTGKNLKSVVTKITKAINGGTHGLDRRIKFTKRALEVLDTEFEI